MKLKVVYGIIILSFLPFILCVCVNAEISDKTDMFEDDYITNITDSQADDMWKEIPDDTKKTLEKIGIDGIEWQNMLNISYQNIFSEFTNQLSERSKNHFSVFVQVFGIILLCSLVNASNFALNKQPLSDVMNLITVLCVCIMVVSPISDCIQSMTNAVNFSSNFMLCYIPIMAGIMIAFGQGVTAVSFNAIMISVSEIVSQISSGVLIPLLNVFLSLALVSSLSVSIRIQSIYQSLMKIIKWILAIIMTVFTGFLSIQNIITSSADSVSYRALKLTFGSFIPVVGSALGEALSTVQASVKLLRSGVGIFAILVVIIIFMPSLIDCLLWIITLNIGICACNLFSLDNISSMFKSISSVLGLMISIMLCSITILTVSTFFILNMGGMA